MDTPAINPGWHRAFWRNISLCVVALCVAANASAQVPEPETIIFGRVFNRTSGQEYQVNSGTLDWTIGGDGSETIALTTELAPIAGGKYSYVLKVPHQARSYQLTVDDTALPLSPEETLFRSGVITINGVHAEVRSSTSDGSFAASQPLRARVHRIDLEVFDLLADTDKDGIPDWWEDKYGLNKQWAGDAALHHAGNRFTYLQAFNLGLDPTLDDAAPQLLTTELTVQQGGATGLLLRTVTSLVLPSQLTYSLSSVPEGGSIILRNVRSDPKMPDRVLKQGDTFTQEAVNAGRVEFLQTDPAIAATSFHVSVTDGISGHVPEEGGIAVTVYRPEAIAGGAGEPWLETGVNAIRPSGETMVQLWKRRTTDGFAEAWMAGAAKRDRIAAFLASRWFEYSVWDASDEQPARNLAVPSARLTRSQYPSGYLRQYGPARSHVIFGSDGKSRLEGGMNADILIAGAGQNVLVGNAGPDIFAFDERTGQPTVEDFKAVEGDVLDFSGMLTGTSINLEDYVQATPNGDDIRLGINFAGTGAAFTDATVTLKRIVLTPAALARLWRSGNIYTGREPSDTPLANRVPLAMPDEGYVVDGLPVTISVLANDTDRDGDALSLVDASDGLFGTVQIVRNEVVYTPGLAFEGADSFTYLVSDGNGGTATGTVEISYPFPAVAGNYNPLVLDAEGNPVGLLKLTITNGGSFTVILSSSKGVFRGRGKFDSDGLAEITLGRGRTASVLSLAINLGDPEHALSGTLSGWVGDLTLRSDSVLANWRESPMSARKFTMSLQAPVGDGSVGGSGFVTVSVARTYAARIAGQLQDGTRFTASTTQRRDGTLAWSTKLYSRHGWVLGSVALLDTPSEPAGGTVKWCREEYTYRKVMQSAFDRELSVAVSLYTPPSVVTSHVLDFLDPADALADVHLRDGGLPAAGEDKVISFGRADAVKVLSPVDDPLRLRVTRSTGLFSGTTSVDGVRRTVSGVFLQDENRGSGYFLNGTASGSVEIAPQ
ncbi:MAG: cadherin-like domain-containing protein [Verrucomicrobiales bacterium]|nr:cadherin-like domain-containing protein [Verrucomicrobiales bacterium]MCP5558798.1 cadherin-like domain-containing protein [Verrucomicrobiaceae bacterium]